MQNINDFILVTGATRGLGFSIVNKICEQGYSVIATGRKKTDQLCQLQEKYKDTFHFEPFDLNDIASIKNFVFSLTKKYGRLYGLVNNAAIGHDGVLATMHESQISQLIKVNVEAPILLAKYASRSMLMLKRGRIVNISSIIANTGFNGLSVYGATKSALLGFTKSLSRELGKFGITVNCVAPGYMETEMTKSLQGEKLQSIIRRSPMKKLVAPSEVANTVGFLISPEASMINGALITVDTGSTA